MLHEYIIALFSFLRLLFINSWSQTVCLLKTLFLHLLHLNLFCCCSLYFIVPETHFLWLGFFSKPFPKELFRGFPSSQRSPKQVTSFHLRQNLLFTWQVLCWNSYLAIFLKYASFARTDPLPVAETPNTVLYHCFLSQPQCLANSVQATRLYNLDLALSKVSWSLGLASGFKL